MLKEFRSVRQEPGLLRRWFTDEQMDLIVWYDEDGQLIGFQLCYDKLRDEHAFTWRPDVGAAHNRIDSGEVVPFVNRTPILVADGEFPAAQVAADFAARSQGIDDDIRQLVLDKLHQAN
jgi:hypothetical protein